MFERFTERAKRTIVLAREEAIRVRNPYLGTEHILLGLIRKEDGTAVEILKKLGLDLQEIRFEVERRISRQYNRRIESQIEIPFTSRAKKVLELAIEEANMMGHDRIGTGHLLIGLIKEGEGISALVFEDMRIDLTEVRREVMNSAHFGQQEIKSDVKTDTLDEFGRDITKLALQGKLDPVIGRENEIERLIQILSRRTKNNPVLIGEPGVGKTAIVEGLAQRIMDRSIPVFLADKRIGASCTSRAVTPALATWSPPDEIMSRPPQPTKKRSPSSKNSPPHSQIASPTKANWVTPTATSVA